jgi:hypothetical protein
MQPLLDLITERQAVTAATITDLREQIGKLTDELRLAETELSDLATTRTTLTRLTSTNESAIPNGGTLDNTVYQQILAAFTTSDSPTMRARDVCHAIGLGTGHNDTEGIRAKLKRLVKRGVLTETGAGQFTLTAPSGSAE